MNNNYEINGTEFKMPSIPSFFEQKTKQELNEISALFKKSLTLEQ